ncbi:MAG: branched-chain amino acid ABC transporter permease [Thermodesulfobacteriota bacterium]
MPSVEPNGLRSYLEKALSLVCLTPLGVVALVLLGLLPFIPPFNQEYLIRWLIIAAFIGAQAIAFDFTSGYINVVNFGFSAFVGLGGYSSALLALGLGLPPVVTMFLGVLPAALLGFLTGVLTLRLRGIFALCMTWFVSLALMGLATKMVWLTRGPLGLRAPFLLDTSSNLPYYYLILTMMLAMYITLALVARSNMGLAFKAIGQNMDAARTSGINPPRYRIINFTISCAFAGWLGGFYAHYFGILTPDLMHTAKTVEILAIVYIGGRGSLWGGAAVSFPFLIAMELVRSSLSNLPGLNLIIYGLALILIMIYYPGGLAHLYHSLNTRLTSAGGPPVNAPADPAA